MQRIVLSKFIARRPAMFASPANTSARRDRRRWLNPATAGDLGRRRLCLALAAVLQALGLPAIAQITTQAMPAVRTSDRLNVDITTGLPHWIVADVGIGPEDLGFRHSVWSLKASFWPPRSSYTDSVILGPGHGGCPIAWAGPAYRVSYEGSSECFYLENGVFSSFDHRGSRLELHSIGYVYTLSDGTRVYYSSSEGLYGHGVKRIEEPDGVVTRVHYEAGPRFMRVRSVEKNTGYRLYFRYPDVAPSDNGWSIIQGVTAYNAAHESCEPGLACAFQQSWPQSHYIQSEDGNFYTTSIINDGGQTTQFISDRSYSQQSYGRFNSVKLPTGSGPEINYTYCPSNYNLCTAWVYTGGAAGTTTSVTIQDLTLTATQNGLTWTYGIANEGPYYLRRNSTGPNNDIRSVRTDTSGNIEVISTPEGNYHFSGIHVMSAPNPDGTVSSVIRDGRGNIVEFRRSGVVEQTVSYPATCVNPVTCNRPSSVTDANGNQTVYEYDPVHGGVLRATGPTVDGVTRETRYVYEQRHAWYLSAAGTPMQDPDPVWILVQESTCRTGPASGSGCATPGDELRTVYERGPVNSLNNLLVRGVVNDATGLAARTCYGYDRFGNRISETAPAAQLSSCP